MQIIVDANPVISMLIKPGKPIDLLLVEELELFSSELLFEEIARNKNDIINKSRLSDNEIDKFLDILKKRTKIIPEKDFLKFRGMAKEVCPDEKDIVYFALALYLKCPVWSNEKRLKEQDHVKVYSTHELMQFFNLIPPKISLIIVPYHLGKENVGMGKGPTHYMEGDADKTLAKEGYEIKVKTIKRQKDFEDEISAIIDINQNLRKVVNESIAEGYFPIVLGGNCNNCLGILAGVNSQNIGIIWFDAHGDFNTPETTITNFFDGMPFAIATGQCYKDISEKIGNKNPVPESNAVLIGTRDLDPKEKINLDKSKVAVVSADQINKTGVEKTLLSKIKELMSKVDEIYLHLDIDVVDPNEAPGVDFMAPNGLSSVEVKRAIKLIGENFNVKAAALTAFNPYYDENDKTLQLGLGFLKYLASLSKR